MKPVNTMNGVVIKPRAEKKSSRANKRYVSATSNVFIAGGGTGGHIYPGLAIAREIKNRYPKVEIRFVGSGRDLEKTILGDAGYNLSLLPVSGLRGVKGLNLIKGVLRIPISIWVAWRLIVKFKPSIVIGVGGYSSGPTVLVASLLGIPVLLQEPNAYPGITNRLLVHFSQKIAIAFPECTKFFKEKSVLTGNPVRMEFSSLADTMPLPPLVILIFGGSQGSQPINKAVMVALKFLQSDLKQLRFIHQTGKKDYQKVLSQYRAAGVQAQVQPFFLDMHCQFKKAHLILCRSGATTLAELTTAGKASLLIPFMEASDNHQQLNAESLASNGAAEVICQTYLKGSLLARRIKYYLHNPDKIKQMEAKSRQLGQPEATKKIVDLVDDLVVLK